MGTMSVQIKDEEAGIAQRFLGGKTIIFNRLTGEQGAVDGAATIVYQENGKTFIHKDVDGSSVWLKRVLPERRAYKTAEGELFVMKGTVKLWLDDLKTSVKGMYYTMTAVGVAPGRNSQFKAAIFDRPHEGLGALWEVRNMQAC